MDSNADLDRTQIDADDCHDLLDELRALECSSVFECGCEEVFLTVDDWCRHIKAAHQDDHNVMIRPVCRQ